MEGAQNENYTRTKNLSQSKINSLQSILRPSEPVGRNDIVKRVLYQASLHQIPIHTREHYLFNVHFQSNNMHTSASAVCIYLTVSCGSATIQT